MRKNVLTFSCFLALSACLAACQSQSQPQSRSQLLSESSSQPYQAKQPDDRQFEDYSKAKRLRPRPSQETFLNITDENGQVLEKRSYHIPREWELDQAQSLVPDEDVAYTAQEGGRYYLAQVYTLRLKDSQDTSEAAVKQRLKKDKHNFSKEGKVRIGSQEWLTGYEVSDGFNQLTAISFYRLDRDSAGQPLVIVGNFLYPTDPPKAEDDPDALTKQGIGHLKSILEELASRN